ncbi:hypothetical protein QJS10_CPB13g00228 [Acorus calamus]|uniref:fructose-bisphosphatase n=1 Tax=Acorus calamus TaxID=4465 RepID=A0AAV9DIU5_ACOCL|nr:hypothetical protein QJS10_CPB13g00228 [Acorus calamus]
MTSTKIRCSSSDSVGITSGGGGTLTEFMAKGRASVGDDLTILFAHLQQACKRISSVVASPSIAADLAGLTSSAAAGGGSTGRDVPKPLDLVSVRRLTSLQLHDLAMFYRNPNFLQNDIILSSLKNSGKVAVVASEEDDAPVWMTDDGPFVVVTDPLDGSRNIDASIPTGTIFGVYNRLVGIDHLPAEEKALLNSLQTGARLVAAGYVLYSSATILCASFGSGTHAFTLDRSTGEFFLTHPDIKIPSRGQIYSVNDARYFDWPEGLRRYIDTIRQGKGRFPKKYSARYICSLVADFHRTLIYGGVVMNPRGHLRLVYEANPLSFLVEQAGGKGSDGKCRILSIQPVELHQRLPLFLGSLEDMEELESYEDIQQKINPGYDV